MSKSTLAETASASSIAAATKDDRVEILMTETIVATDKPDDIAAKRERLKASLARHGVDAAVATIEEGWVNGDRALIGTGLGNRSELTDEQKQRRDAESAAAANEALVTIARNIQANQQPAGGDPAALAAKDAELQAAQAAAAAKDQALAEKEAEIAKLQKDLEAAKKK